MNKKIFNRRILIMALVMAPACQTLAALEVTEHNPDSSALFIDTMTWMLQTSPHRFLFDGKIFIEGYKNNNTRTGEKFEGFLFNNARANTMASTILPFPWVDWLSIAGNFTGILDGHSTFGRDDIDASETGAFNFFAGLGPVLDFEPVTLGFFGGTYANLWDADESVTSIDDLQTFKVLFIPIIKTARWLSFLKSIANYINFGSFDNLDMDWGQRYVFAPFDFYSGELAIELYYNNMRYNALARNWMFGIELKYGNPFYAVFDAGYRKFYDFPDGAENELADSPYAKLILGSATEEGYCNDIHILLSADYQGLGVGGGIKLFNLVDASLKVVYKDSDFSAFSFFLHLSYK